MDPFSAMALIGAGGTLVSNIWNSAEAAKNRRFQERMSSTAHQREVTDLRAAGINPMLSRMGSGASAPGGDRAQLENVGSSALQAKMVQAQIELTKAQTQTQVATATSITNQTEETFAGRTDRLQVLRNSADLSGLSVQERRQLVPLALKRAQAEIKQISSSAAQASANARLANLDEIRAMNEAQFQELLGQAAPWMRTLFLLVRSLR